MILHGYAGKILRADLDTLQVTTSSIEESCLNFLGGRGINQRILLKELAFGVSCFDPASIICFGAGGLVGTTTPGAARLSVDSRNAFTNGIGSGSAGGWFAAELKFAGYDNIVIRGRAKEPVFLFIEDTSAELRSASDLWGLTTSETIESIREDLGKEDVEVLCIGPAGENLARQGCIIVSGGRAVGRCGLGAVMGSKNLKAIVVRGTGGIDIKHPEEFLDLVERICHRLFSLEGVKGRKQFGTIVASPSYNDLSALPYRNYEDDHIPNERLERISHEVFHESYEIGRYACTACPAPCGHKYYVKDKKNAESYCQKVEANSVWNFGGRLAINDVGEILKLQEECCQLGLDIDNTSGVVAWAIDCFLNEVVSLEETGGLNLEWGDSAAILSLMRRIAYRDGFGNLLAEGSARASKIVGKEAERYAFHIKGQDLIEGIRSMKGWALGVVVSARGGTHTRGALATESRRFSPKDCEAIFGSTTASDPLAYEGKTKAVAYYEYVHAILDSLGICFFTSNWTDPKGMNPDEIANLYSFATGSKISVEELMMAGERIHNQEKMFNVAHAGFSRRNDYPPQRLMEEPIKSGPLKGQMLKKGKWEEVLDEYYTLHGWDLSTGWPKMEKLEELGLHDYIHFLDET